MDHQQRPVAFVTGAGRGIGRGIAIELARAGFDIAAAATKYDPTDREKGLAEVADRVREAGGTLLPLSGDLADLSSHESMLNVAIDRFGYIDLLVNNAGVAPRQRLDILETTPESYDRVNSVNARGTFFLTQRIARRMIAHPRDNVTTRPAIIFITSISSVTSSYSRAEYCISKAAESSAAALFADRLAECGINVYEIRPGIISTDMTAPVKEKYDSLIAGGLIPQRRWGTPQDVAQAVASLARGDFDYSTGVVIEVSGGMNIRRLQ